MKRCTKCGKCKPLTEFNIVFRRATGKRKYYSSCKACFRITRSAWESRNPARKRERRRQYHLHAKFCMSEDDYNAMLAEQGGICAICGKTAEENLSRGKKGRRRALSIDHDHATGATRGLLCDQCNFILGHAQDDPRILTAAIAYLAKHRVEP